MSGRFSSAIIFFSVMAIAFAANRAEENSADFRTPGMTAARHPDSIIPSKQLLLGEFKPAAALRHTEKIHGSLNVKIEMVGAKPEHVGDVFVLRGTVLSDDGAVDVVQFKWSLPTGVRHISGEVAGTLNALVAEQPVAFELTLQKTSTSNEQVHLMAGAQRANAHFAESAQYNTDIQDLIDADLAAKKKSFEAAAPDERQLKIYH